MSEIKEPWFGNGVSTVLGLLLGPPGPIIGGIKPALVAQAPTLKQRWQAPGSVELLPPALVRESLPGCELRRHFLGLFQSQLTGKVTVIAVELGLVVVGTSSGHVVTLGREAWNGMRAFGGFQVVPMGKWISKIVSAAW